MSEIVCYCFNYTVADIEQDVQDHQGNSLILDKIMAAKKDGACQCAVKNPKGT
jgi:hypothetical protein